MSTSDGQRGSGTLLVAASCLALMVVAAVSMVLAGYVVAQHAAADAADLAALSGAAAHARGEDACAAARRIAVANRTVLTVCAVSGDDLGFVVKVAVSKRVRPPPGLPDTVVAGAEAGRLAG